MFFQRAKNANEEAVEQEAFEAEKIMKNIMNHINTYVSDLKEIKFLENVSLEGNFEEDIKDTGLLQKDMPKTTILLKDPKMLTHTKEVHLCIFSEKIVIYELLKKKNNEADYIRSFLNQRRFKGVYEIADFSEILFRSDELTVTMNTFKCVDLVKEKSFDIKLSKLEEAKETYEMLLRLNEESEEEIICSPQHKNHNFYKYRNESSEDPRDGDHKKCAECEEYFGGKIWTAVYCKTCMKYFHLNCFERGAYKQRQKRGAKILKSMWSTDRTRMRSVFRPR